MLRNLASARRAKGVSLRQLAAEVGTDKVSIWRYEQCWHVPNVGMALRIAAALGVTVEQLTGEPERGDDAA